MTIHSSDPFATPDSAKSGFRRLRGRLPAAVTLWTALDADARPAGLTVSSTVLVDGEPAKVLGILDEESTLWDALRRGSGRFTVAPLRESDSQLADAFAGLMPAPGGLFAGRTWSSTDWGPVLPGVTGWVGCQLDSAEPVGWGLLVRATVEHVEVSEEDPAPLVHYRGRYLGALRSR